jgi:serine/threonine protein kinase
VLKQAERKKIVSACGANPGGEGACDALDTLAARPYNGADRRRTTVDMCPARGGALLARKEARGTLAGSTLGGYRLFELLGVGGVAEVYRGQELHVPRDVAVKVLDAGLAADAGFVESFRAEAQKVASFAHRNVVPVYHFGQEHGRLYLVMPILRESLRQRLDREGRLDPAEAVRLCVQVAGGLGAAHQRGLVHRDVKPANILLDAEGRALLTDFGIARELDVLRDGGERTMGDAGLPLGTPKYMAPEQLRGLKADQRVDVYGLGAVLYETLTGRVPHPATTAFELVARVLTEPVALPSVSNPAVWPQLDEAVLGALALSPDDRYPDMPAFAAALRRALLERSASGPLNTGIPRPRRESGPMGGPAPEAVVAGGSTAAPASRERWSAPPSPGGATDRPSSQDRDGTFALRRASRRRWDWVLVAAVIVMGGLFVGSTAALLAAPMQPDYRIPAHSTPASTRTVAAGGSAATATPAGAATTAYAAATAAVAAGSSPTIGGLAVTSASLTLYGSGQNHDRPPCRPQGTQTLQNQGAAAISWSATAAASGLTIAPASGTLAPGASVQLDITYELTCTRSSSSIVSITAGAGAGTQFIVTY